MKTCSKGHSPYSDSLILCPACKKEYRKRYYEKNKESERIKTLAWVAANRERYLEAKKKSTRKIKMDPAGGTEID